MKFLLPGVTGAIILRARAIRRSRTFDPCLMNFVHDTGPSDRFIYSDWLVNNGHVRRYRYMHNRSNAVLANVRNRLEGIETFPSPIKGWLFNEQVGPTLYLVTQF